MAIYRLPPSPFIGGRQPLDPRDFNPAVAGPTEDSPTPKFPIPILTAILIAWQPVSIPLQAQRFVPQVAEEQVPFTRHIEVYNSWISEIRITQPRVFTPQVVEEERVVFTRHLEIYNNWIFEQLNPQLPRKYVPETPVVSDFVPYLRPPLIITIQPYRPILPPKLIQEAPAVVNDPPFGQRIWLNQVLTAWIPPPFDFRNPRFYPQDFIPVVVDNPPITNRNIIVNTIMVAWIPPPPMPTNPIVGFTPPTSDDIIIWLWKRVL